MSAADPTRPPALRAGSGAFADPALEALFRLELRGPWLRVLRLAVLVGGGLYLAAILTDYLVLGWGRPFFLSAVARLSVLPAMLACLWLLHALPQPRWVDRGILAFELFLALNFCLILTLQPQAAHNFTPSIIVLVLAYYLLVPNRFGYMLVAGLGTSLAFQFSYMFVLRAPADEYLVTAILLAACNVLGGFVALHMHRLRRREFAGLHAAREINRRLQEEVELRRSAGRQLEQRLQFEELLTGLSTRLIAHGGEQLDGEIQHALESLGRFADADRSYVFELDEAAGTQTCTHEWCAPGIEATIAQQQGRPLNACPWAMTRLRNGQTLHIPRVAELPPEAAEERREFELDHIQSLLLIPLVYNRRVTGFLGFDAVRAPREWSAGTISLLRIVGQMLISAIWRVRTEQALRHSESQYQTLARLSPVGLFRTDARGRCIYVNEGWCRIAGRDPQGSLGEGWVQALHPQDRARVLQEWTAAALAGQPFRSEYRLQREDGSVAWVLGQSQVERDAQGQVTGHVGTIADITARKNAETALQQRTDELERANAELVSSNMDLQQFAYVASHDLQEPLRTITGFSQLIAERYRGRLDTQADELIGYLVTGVARMHALITELLNYSRLDSRATPFRPVPLEESLGGALFNLDAAVQESGATVTHDPLPTVPGEPQQMLLLFQNLVGNAIKFRGAQPPRVHVSARLQDGQWLIAVTDNGIGIEPRHAEHVFQIFRRLHGADRYPGTGIGLAVCRRIIERHHGRIWVEPNPDGGSRFCFTLPLLDAAAIGAGNAPAWREPLHQRRAG